MKVLRIRLLFFWCLLVGSVLPQGVCGQAAGVAPADGVAIYYRTFGDGPPLLVINGGPGYPSNHFTPLAQALSERHRVILFDQRGTGRSRLDQVDTTTVTIAAMVADIEALRIHLGYEAWTVLGHSWGGMLAMLYTAQHPDRVRALILSASGGMDLEFLNGLSDRMRALLTPREQAVHDSLLAIASTVNDAAAHRALRLRATVPAYVYHRDHVPDVVRGLVEESAFAPAVSQAVWSDLRRIGYDVHAAMRRFTKPVLILQGRQDFLGEAVANDHHATFPASERVFLDQCSHYPWLDQTDRYFGLIRAFLAEHVAS